MLMAGKGIMAKVTLARVVTTESGSVSQTPAIRRLPNSDIHSIFEFLHDRKALPSHLTLTLIPSVQNGDTGNLSPPPYQYPGKCSVKE